MKATRRHTSTRARARTRAAAQTAARQAAFLTQFQVAGEIGVAAKRAGIHRTLHYVWLKNPRYARAFNDAALIRVELLETELRRRAMVGWDEPIFYKGRVCGHIRKFSEA